jgi:hypothetical protein
MKTLELHENVGTLLKCQRSVKKLAPYTRRHEKYTTTVEVAYWMAWQNPQ